MLEYAGQVDAEAAAFAYRAVHPDISAALFDDSVDHGQPQTGAFAEFFGGEEGFKNMGLCFFIHPQTVVGDGKHDVTAGHGAKVTLRVRIIQFDVCRFQSNRSAIWHRITRVDHEIENHLLDLSRIGLDRAQIFSGDRDHFDVFADQPAQHFLRVPHQCVEVEDFGLHHLFSTEGK